MQMFLLIIVVWFCMGLAWADESLDDSLHDEHQEKLSTSLEGKRLFFEVYQQASTDTFIDGSVSTINADETSDSANTITENRKVSGTTKKQQRDASPRFTVRYDARVTSKEYLWIVINGTPCDRIDHLAHITERLDRHLACAQSQESDMSFFLLADGKRIQIFRNNAPVVTLLPGQEL